ncbi:uncharacterized protein PODANS_6_10050 [Podospora anserina S mat+]|uniref:Podospora anserina S mat+ genomic DNA chromosome 6, supercontig 4 n=1 Tax=Podospora anserina (strain S / ATCC MYA-4624 / DSM 980 / FGSC 10383) TaxID=515849 RepID=B2ANB0_PODAN|nr:uncharacterized protein PODANS_6_10050 [Podospora anserina S mat+]CAP65509.1 unnamed protein product [Podospora anserina S mat+]CDP31504.1 Putative protein of unknown function [Podospora anserina S mat+]
MSPPKSADEGLDVTKPVDINKLHIEEIDPDGDLVLHVGADSDPTPRTFRVDPAALRRASPVFKAMLFGPSAESKPAGEQWLVSLPEDDPDDFEIILQIVHCQFHVRRIPRKLMTRKAVYGLLLLTDKYQMTHLLAPWKHTLVDFGRNGEVKWQGYKDIRWCPFEAFLSWQLGFSRVFRAHTVQIVYHCWIDPQSRVLVFNNDQGDKTPLRQLRFGPLDMEGESPVCA